MLVKGHAERQYYTLDKQLLSGSWVDLVYYVLDGCLEHLGSMLATLWGMASQYYIKCLGLADGNVFDMLCVCLLNCCWGRFGIDALLIVG